MEAWAIAVVAILALLMCAISAMVAYLLYRPHARKKDEEKKPFDSEGGVATEYGEPPEKGDVKLAVPDDGTLPPYRSKEPSTKSWIEEEKDKREHQDTTSSSSSNDTDSRQEPVDETVSPLISPEQDAGHRTSSSSSSSSSDSDEDKPDGKDEEPPCSPVDENLIVPTQIPKDVHNAPDSPSLSDKFPTDRKSSSSSSSSGDSGKEPVEEIAKILKLEDPEEQRGPSSSSSESEGEIPQPMAPLTPNIVRKDSRGSPNLLDDVLAVVDGKQGREAPYVASSEDDVDEVIIVPVNVKDQKRKDSSSSSSSSSSESSKTSVDEEKPVAEAVPPVEVPKPKERSQKPPDELLLGKQESSSSTTSDEEIPMTPSAAPRSHRAKKSTSSSSSSSDETEDETKKSSTGINLVPGTRRSKRKKRAKKITKSSSSSSDSDDRHEVIVTKPSSSSSSSSSENERKRKQKVMDIHTKSLRSMEQQTEKIESSSSSSSSSSDDREKPEILRPQYKIKFMSGWGRPVKLEDLHDAGLLDAATMKGLGDGTENPDDVERRLRPYLIGSEPVGGILIPETDEKLSFYDAWDSGLISRDLFVSLLEAQAATGRILDPTTGGRHSVEEAVREGLIDKQAETVLNRAERAIYGYDTSSSPDKLSVFQAIGRKHVSETHGNPLLEAQIATGGVVDPKTNHRVPVNVAYERNLIDLETMENLQDPNRGSRRFTDPNTGEYVPYHELLQRCVLDTDTRIKLLPLHDSKEAWRKRKETTISKTVHTELHVTTRSKALSSSTSEADIGVVTTGEMGTQTMNNPYVKKKKKSKKPKSKESSRAVQSSSFVSSSIYSSESEREMHLYNLQGTSRHGSRSFSTPRVEREASNYERTSQTSFPSTVTHTRTVVRKTTGTTLPAVVTIADHGMQTMVYSSSTDDSTSSSDQRYSGETRLKVHEIGVQRTESSESDEEIKKTRVRTQRDIHVRQVGEKVVSTTTYTRTQKNVKSETHHNVFSEPEEISIDLGTPDDRYKSEKAVNVSAPPPKVFFATAWGKEADLDDLVDAGIVDDETRRLIQTGELDPTDDLVHDKISPYINGNRPVAGILHQETGQKFTIFEAARKGLIDRDTAVALLEAQAATGVMVDPHTGNRMTIEEAQKEGFIEGGYEAVINKAGKAVNGYKSQASQQPLCVFEAMKSAVVVPSYGMYLLEAQLATGGIIDPKANHRVPLEVAYRRGLLDQHALNRLHSPSSDSKIVDPNTGENATYMDIIARCVTDLETGVLLYPSLAKERGRSTKSSLSVASYTSIHVRSRSRSRERFTQTVDHKSRSTSTSSSDESRQAKKSELKVSSATIMLAKTPVVSEDEGSYEQSSHISTTVINVEKRDEFDPVQLVVHESRDTTEVSSETTIVERRETVEVHTETVVVQTETVKESSSSSSSSSSEDEAIDVSEDFSVVETVESQETVEIQTETGETVRESSSSSSSEDESDATKTTLEVVELQETVEIQTETVEESSSSSSSEDESDATKTTMEVVELQETVEIQTETVKESSSSEDESDATKTTMEVVELQETVEIQTETVKESSSGSSSEDEAIVDSDATKTTVEVVESQETVEIITETVDVQTEIIEESSTCIDVTDNSNVSETTVVESQETVEVEEVKDSSSSSSEDEAVFTTKDESLSKTAIVVKETGDQAMSQTTKSMTTVSENETSKSEVTTTTTVVTTTEVVTAKLQRKKSRDNIKFKSGWDKLASLVDLMSAGVISKETVIKLEEGVIEEEEVESTIQQYLVGAEPIAGLLLSDTGEKVSIYTAWKKSFIRRGTSISLLEAQAATGRILDPVTGKRYSVAEASKQKLIDRQFEAVLARAERAVTGYTTRTSKDVLSLFQAMKRGLVIENHGIRLLEAQIATGGIIDPRANHRLPVEVAYERGMFDKRMNEILEDPGDDTRGFFDPNTQENLTYLELMERCITDTDTGMRLLPFRTHRDSSVSRSKVVFESKTGRQVTVKDLVNASRLDSDTANRISGGGITTEEKDVLVAKLRVFVDGSMPIAGIINTTNGERMSIYEAAKCELIRKGTAFELLEAQACCGKIVDVQTGRMVTIETAIRSGIIDMEYKDVVERAHRAVTGYKEPFKKELLSLCEAINRHLIVKRYGIRLLEAQIATGGIIDVKSPVRISPQVALKRALIDMKLADELEQRNTQSYFDPVTGENLNYSELMGRCVKDKDTGLLFLMVEGGTVTGYARPFEPDQASKIRSQTTTAGRLTTEEVSTTRSASSTNIGSTTTTTVETTESIRKKKKHKSKKSKSSARSSTSNESSTGTESDRSSILSRRIIIVDPDTNEEITVREALKRRLIDKATAKQLIAQQGDFEEPAP